MVASKTAATKNSMTKVLVGGPLLGDRHACFASDLVSWKEFEPLVTPAIGSKRQRFILLPQSRFISVLSYKTGTKIATLVPFAENEVDKEEIVIESVCLATNPRKVSKTSVQDVIDQMQVDDDSDKEQDADEQEPQDEVVVLAGCRDGTIREFLLNSLETMDPKRNSAQPVDCGPFYVAGPCYPPRRVIQVTNKQPIIHLTAPVLTNNTNTQQQDDGLLVYAIAETKGLDDYNEQQTPRKEKKKEKAPHINISVLRLVLPSDDGSATDLDLKNEVDVERKQMVDHFSCRVGKDKNGEYSNTVPFRIGSIVKPSSKQGNESRSDCIFVVIARTTSIHIYYDRMQSSQMFPPLAFTMNPKNPLSALSISPNKNDITCGHYSGEIRVMNNLLTVVEDYHIAMAKYDLHFGSKKGGSKESMDKPVHPSKTAITTKVHWHAHPVTSLTYDAASSTVDPILYSGGVESVLVTWQLSQGTYKPADVLPRLALGGIVHVVCSDKTDSDSPNGILVYCEDNSLQLFESHNKTVLWKAQGLAARTKSTSQMIGTRVETDPRAHGSSEAQLVLTGLPDAPGIMHWYDPRRHRVSATLEVAPFNRVSRTDQGDSPMPTPSIINHAFSANGDELITLDETPTENTFVGAQEEGSEHGVVTAIRFWSWNDANTKESVVPYTLSAAMTYPHGPKNRVSALAVSNDGTCACTVSNDEKAFRIWHRAAVVEEEEAATGRVPAWSCRYRVTIPSGYSNFATRREGAAFSEDGSIVAIAFGSMITLWDINEARYLTSLRHMGVEQSTIDSVKFVTTSRKQDLLLTKSASGVALQSPFGAQGAFRGWSWGVPEDAKGVCVSEAKMIESHGYVAVTTYNSSTKQSRLILIDGATGAPIVDNGNHIEKINGFIQSIGCVSKPQVLSNWGSDAKEAKPAVRFYGLTGLGELMLFGSRDEAKASTPEWTTDAPFSEAPKLDISRGEGQKRQYKQGGVPMLPTAVEPAMKKMALEIFGSSVGEDSASAPPPSSDLPALSGAFVRSFVGRSLARKTQ
jgi:NET1-associated nuclear protein 1 (U3 small nucleolar RNA-associated protein 17)